MVTKKKDLEYGEFGEADVIKSAFIDGATFYSKPVRYTEVDDLALFEGDIILGTAAEVEQRTEVRKHELRSGIAMGVIITGDRYRWPDCRVPYTISSSLPNQSRVTDAIAHWEANTRFRFVLRNSTNESMFPDWINFMPSNGCSSYVGRQGGVQPINLASGCTTGNTIHEIGHAIGLWHEHSREDRDSRVTINWSKILPGREHNFSQHISDGDDVGTYEYGSIMHYPRTAFSTDGSETITPTNPSAVIGQRNGLSPGDIAAANSMCAPVGPSIRCPPAPFCPAAPRIVPRCPPAPRCTPAPIHLRCPPAPRCTPAPVHLRCPPAPRCTPAPVHLRCPPAPRVGVCPPSPVINRCPPNPVLRRCPPSPRVVRCPPAPDVLRCPPAPGPIGCAAGPYLRPGPRIPTRPWRPGRDPYGQVEGYGNHHSEPVEYEYGYYDSDSYGYETREYAGYEDPYGYSGYQDPHGYDGYEEDWTAYEYNDPYAESYYYDDPGCCQGGSFDPGYY